MLSSSSLAAWTFYLEGKRKNSSIEFVLAWSLTAHSLVPFKDTLTQTACRWGLHNHGFCIHRFGSMHASWTQVEPDLDPPESSRGNWSWDPITSRGFSEAHRGSACPPAASADFRMTHGGKKMPLRFPRETYVQDAHLFFTEFHRQRRTFPVTDRINIHH